MKQSNILDFFKFNGQKQKRSDMEKISDQHRQKDELPLTQPNIQMEVEQDKNQEVLINTKQNNHTLKRKKFQLNDSDSDQNQQLILVDTSIQQNIHKKKTVKNQMEEEKDDFLVDDFLDDEDEVKVDKKSNKGANKKKTAKQQKDTYSSDNNEVITNKKGKKKTETPSFGGMKNTDYINVDRENQVQDCETDELNDRTPIWATPEHLMDANKKKITDPNYDPTTLYIPEADFNNLTNAMKQFWTIKKNNFDKIIFFKLGKFYELFYEDALVGNKYLDLNWMGRKMHTGFPEKALDKYASALVDLGYKVCVVEQTETPKQMQERIKGSKQLKCVNREITQVLTKGTFTTQDMEFQPRYLMATRNMGDLYAISIVDISTSQVAVGYIEDDENLSMFKTLLCQVKPTEVIYDPFNVTPNMLQIFKKGYFKPILSQLANKNNEWHQGTALNYLEKTHGDLNEDNQQKWPKALKDITQDTQKDFILSCLSGLFSYLNKILILDDILQTARYQKYDVSLGIRNCMILDSQALQHLEIVETTLDPTKPELGSLFQFIDKTSSPFSRRMIKNMLCTPLLDLNIINDRLDAIEDLKDLIDVVQDFRVQLKKFPDIPRLLASIYKYSHQSTKKAVFFEDVPVKNLKIFQQVLNYMDKAQKMLSSFNKYIPNMKSRRLIRLLTPSPETQEQENQDNFIYQGNENNVNGLLPPIQSSLADFQQCIEWTGKNKETPIPVQGIVVSYDNAKQGVKLIKDQLQEILKVERKEMRDNTIDFVHVKYRYELEVPEKVVKGSNKPDRYEFTSSKSGYQRFHTRQIKELVAELEEAEDAEKEALIEFIQFVFKQFQAKYKVWDQAVCILSELDCLISLSIVSFNAAGSMCRPNLEYATKFESFMEVQSAWHPCLQMSGVNFIPNDISLGKDQQQSDKNKMLLLLTGPNMGGKSTLLRMTCIIPILAQMGCYVPALTCKMSVVDRIFTRLGASDRLVEGKSTFFIEMEEASNAVKNATSNSLIIMDELGRGTSTFDGVAIAYSILKYLAEEIRCRCMFATHYHILLDEFRSYPQILYGHMACHVITFKIDQILKVNEQNEKVIFFYKLKEGECQSSFGINVAKVVGIDQSILQTAKKQANLFDQELKNKKYLSIQKQYNQVFDVLFNNNDENLIEQLQQAFNQELQLTPPFQ